MGKMKVLKMKMNTLDLCPVRLEIGSLGSIQAVGVLLACDPV